MSEIKKKKSSVISDVRYACAVGATNTVVAIKGAAPIANCSPGCQLKTTAMLTFENGFHRQYAREVPPGDCRIFQEQHFRRREHRR